MTPLCELVLFPLRLHCWFYTEFISPSFFQGAGGVIMEMLVCRGLSSPSLTVSPIGAFDLGLHQQSFGKNQVPGA